MLAHNQHIQNCKIYKTFSQDDYNVLPYMGKFLRHKMLQNGIFNIFGKNVFMITIWLSLRTGKGIVHIV